MTVMEYEFRFSELSRFALGMLSEDGEKARRFQQGLRLAIRNRVVPLAIRDYSELVKRAGGARYQRHKSKKGIGRENRKIGGSSQRRPLNQRPKIQYDLILHSYF